jgi:transposase
MALEVVMSRHELSDEQWSRLEPMVAQRGRGRRCSNLRRVANGILWLLRTGAPWRDLPGEYGPCKTVYYPFSRWRDDGMWDRVMGELQLELSDAGMLDLDLWCVDGSNIRASRAAAGARKTGGGGGEPEDHALGRSRGGYGTKLHLVTDGNGVPLAAIVSPGQRHESIYFEAVMDAAHLRAEQWPAAVAGDKGYSYPRIRRWLEQHHGVAAIPRRRDQLLCDGYPPFDCLLYRRRNVVERCIGWLKECRRVATRFEKLAGSFLAMVKLAMIRRYLVLMVGT